MQFSRVARVVGFGLLGYVGLVVAFETMLGVLQPDTGAQTLKHRFDMVMISTADPRYLQATTLASRS